MKSKVTLSAKDFGDLLIRTVAWRHGISFFPYRIVHSSIQPPTKIKVDVSDKPLSKPLPTPKKSRQDFEGEFTLLKKEVLHGLSRGIYAYKMGKPYRGNCISGLSIEIPSEIRIELKFIPRGSKLARNEFKPFDQT